MNALSSHTREPRGPAVTQERQLTFVRSFLVSLLSVFRHSVALLIILGFTYLFGHELLEGQIWGNDSAYALSIVSWLDRWFPELPLWYPLQGGGSSSIVQYPIGAHYLVMLGHRVTGLSIFAVFRIAQFLSIALTAYGVYFLVWTKVRNQAGALVAGMAYPLSAAAWPWVTDVGLFGQAFSLIYFVPAFLLFESHMFRPRTIDGGRLRVRARLALPATAAAFALMVFTHGASAVVLVMTVLLHAILTPILSGVGPGLMARITRAITRTLVAIVMGLGLAGFWVMPYLHLSRLANREGVAGEFALHQIPYLRLSALIGLGDPPAEWGMWALSMSGTVLLFGLLGFVVSLKRSRTFGSWGLIAIAFAVFTAMPGLWPELVAVFKKLWAYTYIRALIPTMVFVPALAGYAFYELGNLATSGIAGLVRKFRSLVGVRTTDGSRGSRLRAATASSVALAAAYLGFAYLRLPSEAYPTYPGYGATVGAGFWPFDFSGGAPRLVELPSFELNEGGYEAADRVLPPVLSLLKFDAQTRVDISPHLGGILQLLPLYTDASTINIYAYGASLIHAAWGYQQGAFFSEEFGSPLEIEELAKWLGINYVILNPGMDPLQKYEAEQWAVADLPSSLLPENVEIREFNVPHPLASVLRRPTVLVIGGVENDAYMQVLRVFVSGVLTYDDALVIEGDHNIDAYSLSELEQFDALVLHGYGYEDGDKAWSTIREYVNRGGSVFLDTGWQYRTPEWQIESPPDIFPINNLVWMSPALGQGFELRDTMIAGSVAADAFAPLIWDGGPWGMSVPTRGIRDWAHSVLELGDRPVVVAGHYGTGRVVWSGMNIFAHLRTYHSAEEQVFLRNVFAWLLEGKARGDYGAPSFVNDHPDHREIDISGPVENGSYLLWREAFSPDWTAHVEVGGRRVERPIYRAGPGMMLIPLPSPQSGEMRVELTYSFGLLQWISRAVSLITAILLFILVAWPGLAEKIDLTFSQRRNRPLKRGSVAWLPDLDGAASIRPETGAGLASESADNGAAFSGQPFVQSGIERRELWGSRADLGGRLRNDPGE